MPEFVGDASASRATGVRSDGARHTLPTYDELLALVMDLRRALESRPVIDMAKGIVIATTGFDPDGAFQLLVVQSQAENRKLREVAEELVARNVRHRLAGGEGPGPTVRSP